MEQNKTGKYLKYAIGEIVLVVIGILIAIKVNNINIDKIEQSKIRDYSLSLIKDLEEDMIMFNKIRTQTIRTSNRIDSLAAIVRMQSVEEISNIDFVCLTWNMLYMPYSWNRVTLDQLKNSGSMQYIRNDSIIKKIGDYDALTRHLDEDYINDKVKTESIIELVNMVTNNNYSSVKDFRENVLLKVNNINYEESSYFFQQEYEQAKSLELKLITNDINELHQIINGLMRLQFHLNLRSEIELPRLENYAEELINKLKFEYEIEQ